MQPREALRLLLLLYVAIDYMDPGLPGAFCFENDAYFLDGVVDVKDASSDIAAADAVIRQRGRPADAECVDDSRRTPVPASPPARARWRDLEHRDSALSTASQDSSSVGPA
jgi:hypothetical protein